MKTVLFGTCLFVSCVWPLGLVVSAAESTTTLTANDPVQKEMALITKAHHAARADDDDTADAQIGTAGDLHVAPSVLLARRAMTVCGWLQNDNEYGRANKVAQRALKRLADMKENNDKDREERLYWEAALEGRILDHKRVAIKLLATAEKLIPNDTRVLDLERELTPAVAQFGH